MQLWPLKFPLRVPIAFSMTQFSFKALADDVGYGIATDVIATSTDLQTDLDRMAAIRKTQGLPSFDEQEAADKAEFREMIAEGFELDPELVAWAQET